MDKIYTQEDMDRALAEVAAHEREKLRCAIILNDDGGTYSTHESKEQLEWMLNMSSAKEVIEAKVLAERVRMCKQFNISMELANETATGNEAD